MFAVRFTAEGKMRPTGREVIARPSAISRIAPRCRGAHAPGSLVRLAAVLLAAVLLVQGCASSQTPPAPQAGASAEVADIRAYRLGPGDKLKVTVFGQPQESGQFEIDGSGNLAYPLIGAVPAQGLTVPELQEKLRFTLDQSYIVNPRVSIEVLNYRPFYIYGEVQKAGSYPFVAGLTVRRAVAIAGGYTRRARFAPVTVVREGPSGPHQFNAELDVPIMPGDTLEIMQRLF